mgnify:CR=1 FL=1
MLELLHIENIAVIEEADIRFRPGFNALTGETRRQVHRHRRHGRRAWGAGPPGS